MLTFPMPAHGGKIWKYIHIRDLEKWLVQDVKVPAPSQIAAKTQDGRMYGILLCVENPKVSPLLRSAALRGFKGLTVVHMKKLIKLLGWTW